MSLVNDDGKTDTDLNRLSDTINEMLNSDTDVGRHLRSIISEGKKVPCLDFFINQFEASKLAAQSVKPENPGTDE